MEVMTGLTDSNEIQAYLEYNYQQGCAVYLLTHVQSSDIQRIMGRTTLREMMICRCFLHPFSETVKQKAYAVVSGVHQVDGYSNSFWGGKTTRNENSPV